MAFAGGTEPLALKSSRARTGSLRASSPELSLFNPWHLASSLELRSAGRTVCAGRDALAAHGTSQHSGFLHIPTAERYELAVDAERGVILKHDALFDERSLEVYEVIDIAFDADLDPGLFRVEGAPEHVNIARVSGRGRESMCSFCGLTRSQVMSLVAGDGACICDGCIDLCKEIIDEQRLVPG